MNRREFIAAAAAVPGLSCIAHAAGAVGPQQATGVRVGEVSADAAIVWTRLTRAAERNHAGVLIPGRAADLKGQPLPEPTVPADELEGACPPSAGRVRVRVGIDPELTAAATTDWVEVTADGDGIHQFPLTGLRPGTRYHYAVETVSLDGATAGASRTGRFRTAPRAEDAAPVRFCVMTCQGYPDRGHPDGHGIYPSMQALDPDFVCLTGDLVYYDNDLPRANSPRLARYHWERMFSLPRLVEFNRHTGTYWLKDDHDTLENDTWPGQRMGELTFAEGQRIFRQQAPLHDGPAYRTFRWGRDLQIWLAEGRDFRSPNSRPDGADKTIWGAEQIAWFQESVLSSDATWKVLVSPTPFVGPDRPKGKNDNHSNVGFRYEGDLLRDWLKAHTADRLIVICGDRHWQYHSVHPQTGLHEFSVGAASDEHAGGTPGYDPAYHKFHRVAGGFLEVQVQRAGAHCGLTCRHRDVNGRVVYEFTQLRNGA